MAGIEGVQAKHALLPRCVTYVSERLCYGVISWYQSMNQASYTSKTSGFVPLEIAQAEARVLMEEAKYPSRAASLVLMFG